jgi:hypothetical protein
MVNLMVDLGIVDLGIAVSVNVCALSFYLLKRDRCLTYEVLEPIKFPSTIIQVAEMKIDFEGAQISKFFRTVVRFRNGGTQSFKKEQFIESPVVVVQGGDVLFANVGARRLLVTQTTKGALIHLPRFEFGSNATDRLDVEISLTKVPEQIHVRSALQDCALRRLHFTHWWWQLGLAGLGLLVLGQTAFLFNGIGAMTIGLEFTVLGMIALGSALNLFRRPINR